MISTFLKQWSLSLKQNFMWNSIHKASEKGQLVWMKWGLGGGCPCSPAHLVSLFFCILSSFGQFQVHWEFRLETTILDYLGNNSPLLSSMAWRKNSGLSPLLATRLELKGDEGRALFTWKVNSIDDDNIGIKYIHKTTQH